MAAEMTRTVPVIGVGASAGGLEAIREMLGSTKPESEFAFVVIQHLDPNHESLMAELLSRQTPLPVRQVKGGERVDGGHVYVIPPGHGLRIDDGKLELTEFAQPRGLRRPIDDFFESLAQDQREDAACVILSGTGADGTSGLRAIKEHGGLCIAQEPETARYEGMPVSAIGTGLIDFVCAPADIVPTLANFFARRTTATQAEERSNIVADQLDDICVTLRRVVGHDFTGYKRTTLVRRVERRMQVLGLDDPRDYLSRINEDSDECEALFRDLLINVTRFFRDPEMFEMLRTRVIDPLVKTTPTTGEIRIWVPGCSSGEEAYSIAMLVADALKAQVPRPLVQIFATDIDESMLAIAREGRYPMAALADIPERLRENFTIGRDGVFQMSPKVRDLVRFSQHSLIKDPPFSKLNLISCRNLLIYLGDKLQQQAFPIFHYALNPGGHLFLGPSESIGRFENLFSVEDQKSRIFTRLDGRPIYPINLPASVEPPRRSGIQQRPYADPTRMSWEESLSVRRIVDRYAPASMVIDHDGAIVKSSGRLARYFEFPGTGQDHAFALSLARPGLREILPRLTRQAQSNRSRAISRGVEVVAEFGTQEVDVIADPLADGTILLVFRETGPFVPSEDDELVEIGPADDEVQQLQDELRLVRHRLRSTVEELETANEELKSSNEEMMSMNEELQSTNEELTTVNDELKSKIDQLTVANSDLRNFFESTQLAVVVLDGGLRVRSFTDAATEIFPLLDSDRGRALSDVSCNLIENHHLQDAEAVLLGRSVPPRTVTSGDGSRKWALQVLPYRVLDGSVAGATIVLNDITDALQLQQDFEVERERLELAIRVAKIGIWEYHVETGEVVLDDSEKELFGVESDDEANNIEKILSLIHPDDRPTVEAGLRPAISGEADYEASFRVMLPNYEVRHLRGLGRLVAGSEPKRLIGVNFDVTPEMRLAEQREFMLSEMNHRVKNLFAIIAGFVTSSARKADDPQTLARDVRSRIEALGRSHTLTQGKSIDETVDLSQIVESALRPYADGEAVVAAGPEVALDFEHITPIALILHEWATNGSKYGALGDPEGRTRVAWTVGDGDRVRLTWEEESDRITMENHEEADGFGTRLVNFSLNQIDGEAVFDAGDGAWKAELEFSITA